MVPFSEADLAPTTTTNLLDSRDQESAPHPAPTAPTAVEEPFFDPVSGHHFASEAEALAELDRLQRQSFEHQGPVLALCVAACEFLWQMAHKQPVIRELHRRTGLNRSVFRILKSATDPQSFADLWSDHLPSYYYAMLVGRLVLESPLQQTLLTLVMPSGDDARKSRHLLATVAAQAKRVAPLTERWLIGHYDAVVGDPLPDDPVLRAELAGWEERRAILEDYFTGAVDVLMRANSMLLEALKHTMAPAAPTAPRGPFLRRTFADAELAALRLLLTTIPAVSRMLPGQLFALRMHRLSALQPTKRVEQMLQRLREVKPGQPLHLSLTDCLTLLQTLQAGALLLLRATTGDLIATLRRHATDPHDPDEDLRIERGRLLFLLSDDATRTQFRATFGPLLKNFVAAVDRLYPHAPELAQARVELAELAAVR